MGRKSRVWILILLLIFILLVTTAGRRPPDIHRCRHRETEFCDNFAGRTRFKDETRRARWYRTDESDDFDDAYFYENTGDGPTRFLRVGLTTDASGEHANYAEIGLVEINNHLADFPIPVNSRVEARMRYAPDMNANNTVPGQGVGAAGLLFWDYHFGVIDYDNKILPPPRDAFGFVWQQPESTPNPGFWISNVGGGMPGAYVYYPDIDLSDWHVYAIERRHDSMTYFIDGQLVYVQPLNQPDSIQLADEQNLTVDFWRDNIRYNFDPATFSFTITFEDVQQESYVDLDYFQVTELDDHGCDDDCDDDDHDGGHHDDGDDGDDGDEDDDDEDD